MPTILVVDDEITIVELLQVLFEGEGYNVLVARDGREGFATLAHQRPDVVLSDVMMPVMDGRTLCRMMKADATYQAIPVVLMSAGRPTIDRDECNYDAFVRKPFMIDVLLQTIAQLLGFR